MIEIVAAISALNAAFNGVKSVVEAGKEAEDIFHQLTKWAQAVDDVHHWMGKETKPSIWKNITFDKSEMAEAFDTMSAKQKLADMEKEIYHMFTWGELGHLGIEGYREFQHMRKQIKYDREKLIGDQLKRRKEFIHSCIDWTLVAVLSLVTIYLIGWLFEIVMSKGSY